MMAGSVYIAMYIIVDTLLLYIYIYHATFALTFPTVVREFKEGHRIYPLINIGICVLWSDCDGHSTTVKLYRKVQLRIR